MLRMVGKHKWDIYKIRIQKPKGGKRKGIYYSHGITEPFVPKSTADEYHPGGNSLCYLIQTAHCMGADKIHVLGFTLQNGAGYFFGGNRNPVTRRTSYWDVDRATHWLRWYEKKYPGKVLLDPQWSGPLYEIFSTFGG